MKIRFLAIFLRLPLTMGLVRLHALSVDLEPRGYVVDSVDVGLILTLGTEREFLEGQKVPAVGLVVAGPSGPSVVHVLQRDVLALCQQQDGVEAIQG